MVAITIRTTLEQGVVDRAYSTALSAAGGTVPYRWDLVEGSELPPGLNLDSETGLIAGTPTVASQSTFVVVVKDSSPNQMTETATVRVNIVTSDRKHWWQHAGSWLGMLALGLPLSGLIWIACYAFATSGPHVTYLGVGMLTTLASFVVGCLIGFLFGIPKIVSSGEARQNRAAGSPAWAPSSNLAEVSDWLTKLLLGAGLVSLTKLGPPLSALINAVAAGLGGTSTNDGLAGSATVLAGAILFGYTAIGFLDGYVMTTVWYQRKLAEQR
jgi:hypothetical protein